MTKWKAFLVVIAATTVALLLGEGIVRVFLPQNLRPTFQVSDERVKNRLRPNSSWRLQGKTGEYSARVRTNSMGWRMAELDDRPKIMLLGDSFTFGFGVEQNQIYAARLEAGLTGKGENYQVVNLGVEGRSPDQYLADYHYFSDSLQPRLLIVGFCEANDFIDGSEIVRRDEHNALVFRPFRPGGAYYALRSVLVGPFYDLLAQHSHFATLLKDGLFNVAVRSRMLNHEVYSAATASSPEASPALSFTTDIFTRLIAEASGDGLSVVIILIPDKRPHPLTPRFLQSVSSAGAMVINLRPQIEACGHSTCYFSRDDDHWNSRGHEVAANALIELLSARRPFGESVRVSLFDSPIACDTTGVDNDE